MSTKRTPELPAMEGKGVEAASISEIDQLISKYERKKEARCAESPGEVAAKTELRQALHAHRAELPVKEDGSPFYRYEGRDYLLTETLKVRTVEQDGEGE